MNILDLQGRRAVVTGGASGLGFAISQRLLASGARLAWWDVNADTLERGAQALGAPVQTVIVDVTRQIGRASCRERVCYPV